MFICLHVEPAARHQVYLRLDQQRAVDATGEDLGHDVPVPEAPNKRLVDGLMKKIAFLKKNGCPSLALNQDAIISFQEEITFFFKARDSC